MAVEQGVGDIHLVNRPAARDGELEDSADRARFDNRGERLREINSSALAETADHPASLVALKSTSEQVLWRKTHLPVMTLARGGWGTRVQVRFR